MSKGLNKRLVVRAQFIAAAKGSYGGQVECGWGRVIPGKRWGKEGIFSSSYLVPRTDNPWAIGKGTRKARAEPVVRSKVRKTKIVSIFAEKLISFLFLEWLSIRINVFFIKYSKYHTKNSCW